VRVAAGAEIVINDDLGVDRHVKLEHFSWASDAATAFDVSTMPEFRRIFSREVLSPGRVLSVTRTTFLFTDLAGSTALYSAVGDAAAYAFIREHFDRLTACVERGGGAVVKTLGDSIMAVFPDEMDAVRAALDMQRDHRDHALLDERGARVGLKIGVFSGPCYAVTANGVLDYFGLTVNTAQRLESLAEAGDVLVSREIASGWTVGDLPEGARTCGELRVELRGVPEAVELTRLRVD
jgi:class 3 adenylate cyclase